MNRYARVILLFIISVFVSELRGQASSDVPIIEIEGVYSALPWYNVSGGVATGAVYMDNVDLTAKVNFDQIFNLEDGLSLFIYGLGNNGQRATRLVGDYQVASNIEAVRSYRFFELWMQRNFINDRISILAGLYDLNSEFDILKPGTLFINSSFGIGAEYAQAGQNGPSIFPVSSLGVRLSTFIGNRTKLKLAVLDAVPGDPQKLRSNEIKLTNREGALIAGEVSLFTSSAFSESEDKIERSYQTRRRKVGREYGVLRNDKINLGAWYFTSRFQPIGDSLSEERGNFGVYIGMQKYFQFNSAEDYLSLFARLGMANSKFNRFGSAISGGMVATNPLTGIDDSFGLAFSSGINGQRFAENQMGTLRAETALEFTYSLHMSSWLLVQPDIQYVIHPSTNPDLANSLSFAMLVQVTINN